MRSSSPAAADRKRWLWLLVPLGTLGIAAFVPPAYFALRFGRRGGYVWASVLLGAIVAFFVLDPSSQARGVQHGLAVALIMVCWVGGAAVAGGFVATTTDNDAVRRALEQRRQRQKARTLIRKDPKLAVAAHVGRPDVAGNHDDGGLVDVNRAGVRALAAVPGVSDGLAQRIVETRQSVGGYSSLDDLIASLDLNPRDLDDASDWLAFIPL